MSHRTSRMMCWTALACGLAMAMMFGKPHLVAQEKKGPANNSGKALPKIYYGTVACGGASCHGADKAIPPDPKDPQLCRFNELTEWTKHDKHGDAYLVLLGRRGQQMLNHLKIDLKVPEQAKLCVNCHGVLPEPDAKLAKFDVKEGVSCVVCHGSYGPWVGTHINPLEKDEFRVLSRTVKQNKYGMTDLWDPITRTRLCTSCHIGSVEEGKVVTHDMYAAGHPPLPGFEVASFCNMMPAHWQQNVDKDKRVQKILGFDGKTQEQAKLVLVGAAVSMAEYLKMVLTQAEQAIEEVKKPNADEDKVVVDWASFDCWACHHDLKSPSWRQERGYPGKPGRVPMKTWPAELVRLALDHLGEDKAEFEKLWGKVQAAFVAKQFGDNKQIVEAARPLMEWSNKLAVRLNKATVDREAASKLLAKLPTLGRKTTDFDGARQLGWAYEAIWREHSKSEPSETFKVMSNDLGLTFPVGRMDNANIGVVTRELSKSMKRIYDYEPQTFLQQLRTLNGKVTK